MEKKKCNKCNKLFFYSEKAAVNGGSGHYKYLRDGKIVGYSGVCHACFRNYINRKNRLENFSRFKRYEKTPNGFLMRAYRNMKSRVTGVQQKKHHLYKGLSILSKEEFYEWSKKSKEFKALFLAWEKSGHERRLTPSVDRVNSSLGYELTNMRWVEFHKNCSNVCHSKRNKHRPKTSYKPTP